MTKLNWYYSLTYIAFWIILYFALVVPCYHYSPKKLTKGDEKKYPNSFIGERAEENLIIFSAFGPKIVGSDEYDSTLNFILDEIATIEFNSNKNLFNIEFEVQNATGSFTMERMGNVYQGIQNIVVKLSPRNETLEEKNITAPDDESCLLINSHFDTVTGSPGAGDDGIMVVVMLEILRVLSQSKETISNSILFLFNGGEEHPLRGSFAFITQHRWAHCAKALINLDSAGSGGREILFQSDPNHPWLMKYYSKSILYPFASTLAEELFQNDFIPSYTDFKIFQDYGGVPGFDLAHTYNGYIYHTKYDRYAAIKAGSFQLTGNNVLALTKALANASELRDSSKMTEGQAVFYDFCGWFMIYYTETQGIIINLCVSFIAIGAILISVWLASRKLPFGISKVIKTFLTIFALQIFSIILTITLVLLLAMFLDGIGSSMSWYTETWLLLGLYFCPSFFLLNILIALYLENRYEKHNFPISIGVQLAFHSHCIILVIMTITLTAFAIRSAFIVMVAVFFYTISVILNMILCMKKPTLFWMIPHIICQILPFLFYTYLAYTFFVTFIPMQGRNGVNFNPEIFISCFCVFITLLFAAFLLPLLNLFEEFTFTIFAILTAIFLILAGTPIGFPYREKTAPQRFTVIHTSRIIHDFNGQINKWDTGFYVRPEDRRPNSIKYDLVNYQNMISVDTNFCSVELYCGLPLINPNWGNARSESFWIAGPGPDLLNAPKLKKINATNTNETTFLFNFEVTGPDHMVIYIEPLIHSRIKDSTFKDIFEQLEPPYFIYYSYGVDQTPLRFFIEIENKKSRNGTKPILQIGIGGHWLHHNKINTDHFNFFLSTFPKWTYPWSWIGSYENWLF